MLLAVKLWATAHLLANGTLADVLLFGGFLAWAVADRISVKRRPAARQTRAARGPLQRPRSRWPAACSYTVCPSRFLHVWLIGVAPR